MGDTSPRRLSLPVAGSSHVAPTVPLHHAHARQQQQDLSTIADRLESGAEEFELGEVRTLSAARALNRSDGHFLRGDSEEQRHLYNDLDSELSEDENDNDNNIPITAGGMPHKKSKSRSPNPRGGRGGSLRRNPNRDSSLASSVETLGKDGLDDADMNGAILEQRKRHPASSLEVLDDDSVSARDRLMGRNEFSLDHPPPETPGKEGEGSKGFWELPEQDRRNFLLLVLLYFLQGVPMGLAGGSIPFLLKSHLSYSQIGIYSLASYPYSLKLLWSPIVDAVWSSKVGRRKSWILPIQTLSGFGMIWLGTKAEQMMVSAGDNGGAGVWGFTGWWFSLVFMCATQDIAVDGWALTLLSPSNLSYASTAQTVGLTGGQFLSYTVFLALNSPDFANKYFRTEPLDVGLMTLNSYLTFWGWFYLAVTLGLAVLKQEERTKVKDGIWDVYKIMGGILKLRNIQVLMLIHLIGKIGFQANDTITNLKLLDKGFSQEDLALTVLIDFPFEMALGYYAGKWSEQYQPVRVWCWAFVARLIAALFAQLVVMFFPASGTNTSYLLLIILMNVYSTSASTVMFVAVSAFHAKISDPVIGGTYMTMLATVSNLGGTFPRFFVLRFVDAFSKAACIPPVKPPSSLKGDLITQSFSCVAEAEKHRCIDGGGTCNIERDGFYVVNILCVLFGVVTFWSFIRPQAMKLQQLPMRAWRLANAAS